MQNFEFRISTGTKVFEQPLPPRFRLRSGEPLVSLRRQDGIRGAGSGAGKLLGRYRLDDHLGAELLDDRARELVPRAIGFVGVMDHAARILIRDPDEGIGEMRSVRRAAALIVHDAQKRAALADLIANGLYEIRPVDAEKP